MKKAKEMKIAHELRKQGYSLSEISNKLHVSKSTASVWSKNIMLSPEAKQRLSKRTTIKSLEGLRKYSEKIKQDKVNALIVDDRSGASKLGNITNRDIYCIGLGLYWGEGYKSGSQEFGFTNSDSHMILFYIKWLGLVFDVKKSDLILRVSINVSHKKRMQEVQVFWSKVTKVPLSQFSKISFIASATKKHYSNASSHMGTLRIKVRKGTKMRREVIGAIKHINIY